MLSMLEIAMQHGSDAFKAAGALTAVEFSPQVAAGSVAAFITGV